MLCQEYVSTQKNKNQKIQTKKEEQKRERKKIHLLDTFFPRMCRWIGLWQQADNAGNIHLVLVSDMLVNIQERDKFRVDKSMYH